MRLTIQEKLYDLVEDVVDGRITFEIFRKTFMTTYTKYERISGMNRADEEFFSLILQKLSWVDMEPDANAREHGWISESEFLEWLRSKLPERPQ